MSYPILTAKNADEVAAALRDSEEIPEDLIEWTGQFDIDVESIENASQAARDEWESRTDLDKLSAQQRETLDAYMAPHVHRALKDLPPQVLDDMGFWRYLALFPFRWFLMYRRPSNQRFSEADYGGGRRSVRNFHDYQYIVKAYRRGQIAYDDDNAEPYERAGRIVAKGERDIDVWDSHFLRTKIGDLRVATHAIYDEVTEPTYFGRDPIREYAKLVTRERNNVLLDIYDYEAARAFAKSKRTRASQLRAPEAEPESRD